MHSPPCDTALSTHLIGSTLHGVLSTSNPVALAAIWNRVSEKLSPRNGVSVQDIFQTAFINLLLHPVWYNHSALLRSIQTILPSTSVSHISPSNSPDAVGSLVLERWKTRGGDTKSLLELWLGILEVYVAEFERETRPLGFGHIAISAAIPGSPAIIRRGGVLSCITPGSFSESAMLVGLSSDDDSEQDIAPAAIFFHRCMGLLS